MEELAKELKELEDLKNLMIQIESVNDSSNFEEVFNVSDYKIKTKFTNSSNNPDPEYAKVADSGFDIRANITEPITLKPLERVLVPTGLRFELPTNT